MIPKIYFIKILLKNTANRCKYVQLLGGAKSDNWKIKHLSISFSDVDVINHFFGSSSLESEDIILKLDNTLVDLFEFIDQKIGLKHWKQRFKIQPNSSV